MTVNEAMTETIMGYLTSRRMSSLGNVAMHFDCPISKLIPVVKTLESKNRLRLAMPRCGSACSNCDGCEPEPAAQMLTGSAILISLDKKEDLA